MRIIPTWARTENYPAGGDPWSGNPTKATPVADYVTPDTLLPAEHFNYLLTLSARDGIQAAQATALGSKWAGTAPSSGAIVDIVWAWPIANWLALIDAGGGTFHIKFIYNVDGDFLEFKNTLGTSTDPQVIWAASGAVIIGCDNGEMYRIAPGAAPSAEATLTGDYWDSIYGLGHNTATAFIIGGSATNCVLYKTTNSGDSWSTVTVPADFSTYLGGWHSPSTSGTATIFCPDPTGPSQTKIMRVTGAGATAVSVGTNVYTSCYDPETEKFFVFVVNLGDTTIYSSSDDGATFSSTGEVFDGYQIVESVGNAGVLVVKALITAPALTSDSSANQYVIMYCFTNDISTWYITDSGHLGTSAHDMALGEGVAIQWSPAKVLTSGIFGIGTVETV